MFSLSTPQNSPQNQTPIITFSVNTQQQCFESTGPELMSVLDYTADEWQSTEQWLGLIHNEDRPIVRELLQPAGKLLVSYDFSFRIRQKSGQYLWMQCYASFNAQQTMVSGVFFEISGRKRIEDEMHITRSKNAVLTQELQTLLSLFDMGDVVLFKWRNNENWNVDYVSQSVEQLLGYTQYDFTHEGKLYGNCIHPHDLERVLNEVKIATHSHQTFFKHEPYRIVDKQNQIKWVSDITYILRDTNNHIINFIGYIYDISIEQQANRQFQNVLDLQDNIIVVSNGLEIQQANQAFLEFTNEPNLDAFKKKHHCICDFFLNQPGHYSRKSPDTYWLRDIQDLPETERLVAMKNSEGQLKSFKVKIRPHGEFTHLITFNQIPTPANGNLQNFSSNYHLETGCLNSDYLHKMFDKFQASAKRNNHSLCLILLQTKTTQENCHEAATNKHNAKTISTHLETKIRLHDDLIQINDNTFLVVAEVAHPDSGLCIAQNLLASFENPRMTYPDEFLFCSVAIAQEGENSVAVMKRLEEGILKVQPQNTGKPSIHQCK